MYRRGILIISLCRSKLHALKRYSTSSYNCGLTNPFPVIQCNPSSPNSYTEENLQLYGKLDALRRDVSSLGEREVSEAKLNVRHRLELLADKGSEILELGLLAGFGLPYGDVPSAGNVVCVVDISGEKCVVSANDWTVKGGCSFPITLKKQLRAQEIAFQNHLPCIYLVDSGGAFLPLQVRK